MKDSGMFVWTKATDMSHHSSMDQISTCTASRLVDQRAVIGDFMTRYVTDLQSQLFLRVVIQTVMPIG